MDEQVEKERAIYATLRGTMKKSLRPTKSSRRVNENFEDFMRMAQQTEEQSHSQLLKSKSMSTVDNTSEMQLGKKVTREASMQITKQKPAAPAVELKVEVEPKVQAVLAKEIAPDDASLAVFLQAWNQLDTLEEQLAVHEELAEVEEKLQLAQEEARSPREPAAVPATPTREPSPRNAAPETPKPELEPVPASPAKPEPVQQPEVPATPEPVKQEPIVSPRKADDSIQAPIPKSYKGPHYKSPVTQDFVEGLLQYCADEGLSATVPYAYVKQVILDAMEVFRNEPTILDVPLVPNSKVVVIGDIHGQFPDLITILRDTGLPGPTQTLIFNGDFVDRGPAGVEVLLSLYVMKLCWPNHIYLHRGNHELESINRKYNFADQVIKKYDEELFTLIQDSFALLPLGGVIANKVLVIHGGLPDEPVSLPQIRALPKVREDPTKATSGPEKLIQGVLWSDPRDRKGTRASKRGAGVEFGPDITSAFMARSGLDLIVRSHEMVEEGFSLTHDGNIMTIFSASYYCGVSTNKGAFAVFAHGGDLRTPSIVQYYAQAYSARDNVLKSCVKETLEKLREMIFVARHRLCLEFSKRDPKVSGKISKEDWCDTMSSVMGLHIGWHGMLPYLVKVESDDRINFIKFLDRYKITPKIDDDDDDDDDEDDKRDKQEEEIKKWQKEAMGQFCINTHTFVATTLNDAFTKFDADNDGKLSYREFIDAIALIKLNASPPDDNYYYDLLRRMDLDEDGVLSRNDFYESLKDAMERTHTLHKEDWIPEAIAEMRAVIDKNFDFIANQKSRLKSAFRKCRSEGGKVQRKGFSDWIERTLEIEKYSSVQKMRIALYVDFNGNGKISWREFKKVFLHPQYYATIQEHLFRTPDNP
jgi:hypothetical protein